MPSQNSLEKETATHSIILAWRIPWTEESGGLVYGGHKELDTTEQLTLWLSSQSSHSSPALLICFQESWTEFMKKYSVPGWQEVLSKVNPMPGAGRFLETSESNEMPLTFICCFIYIYKYIYKYIPLRKHYHHKAISLWLNQEWIKPIHSSISRQPTVSSPSFMQNTLDFNTSKILLTPNILKLQWDA